MIEILFTVLIVLFIFILFVILRIYLIQKEINRTWELKKYWLIENLLKEPIKQHIEEVKRIKDKQKKK